jgi:NADH-quinone oxidoreductase subunit J
MSIAFLVFFLCAFLAILGSILLIFAKEPIHSALALVLVMMSLAVLYLLLGAPFVAAVQILVYAGAIMVLFVFVIMLLNAGVEERTNWSKIAWIGMFLSAVIIAGLGHWLYHSQVGGFLANTSAGTAPPVDTVDLSKQLFREYLFPFEATSILILIAMLGAMVLAKKDE